MLKGLFDLIKNFFDIIGQLLGLIWNMFVSLLHFIATIPVYVTNLVSTVNLLPAFLLPFAVACISISVVQYILNRKGG